MGNTAAYARVSDGGLFVDIITSKLAYLLRTYRGCHLELAMAEARGN